MTVFAKGAWYALDDLCDSGYDCVSLDWLYDPKNAVKVVNGRRITLQGNLDPGVMYGSDKVIAKKVKQCWKGLVSKITLSISGTALTHLWTQRK